MPTKNIFYIPLIQGIYFLITLGWPVIEIRSFIAVTGLKVDIWLVKTVSVLLLPYAAFCFWAAMKRPLSIIIILCMVLMSWGLAFVELYYYFNGTIKWVYAVDALLQILFSYWWINLWRNKSKINQHEK